MWGNKDKRLRKGKSLGQTLIEVIVALVLVEFALISIASAGVVSVKNSRVARERAEARSIAETVLEQIRVERNAESSDFFAAGTRTEVLPTQGTTVVYTPTVRYTKLSNDQIEVEVEVAWGTGQTGMSVVETTSFNRWQ